MNASADPEERVRLSIASYLGIGLGGLVATALALLLWVTLSAVFKNTTELLDDKSRIFLTSLSAQTRQYLDATLASSQVAANQIGDGAVDPEVDGQMMPLMRTLLAAAPQVTGMAYFDVDGTRVVAYREDGEVLTVREASPDRAEIRAAMDGVRKKGAVVWGPPIYDQGIGTFINLRRPVFKDDAFIGMMTAVIDVQVLSTFLGSMETEIGQNAFILYDRDYVLAHPRLIEPFPGLGVEHPLPTVTEVGDPVLAAIWRQGWEEHKLVAGHGHADDHGDRAYIFLYKPLLDYADAPWLIGSYFPEDAIGVQFERMVASGALSLLIVLLTILATYMFGRFLKKPIARLAGAASALRGLDFDHVDRLPSSRFAELDDAGRAFNGMIAALRSFSRYVPKTLVARLVQAGDIDAIRSELKMVTIMMTDVVGFTARAEKMGAEETADYLNAHLALVADCIEAEGGIIDKYMGDGVMAHWGALDPEPDHGERAVRAALRIRDAQRADNSRTGQATRLRIGIHSGDVVAGNLGTATRMNYTVVGDAVNMAQRLEALGKELLPHAEIAILISAETARLLDDDVAIRSLGAHELRGREASGEVFALEG